MRGLTRRTPRTEAFIDARQFYSRVEAPVTLVHGEPDWSKPLERESVAGLAGRLIMLAETGHFSSLERPGEVARILLDLS